MIILQYDWIIYGKIWIIESSGAVSSFWAIAIHGNGTTGSMDYVCNPTAQLDPMLF